jgi:tRNA(Ile)-lysidine synthase
MAGSRAEAFCRRIEGVVRRYMAANDLWLAEGGLVAGVSGGPDSSALLLILSALAQRKGIPLTAAYFDHQLRGAKAAAAERRAVEALAERCGVPLVRGGADVRTLARSGRRSIEEAARVARYGFLAEAAMKSGTSTVAVGHTEDDQAETVLLHLLRGSGLAGLAGMAPRAGWPVDNGDGLSVVRPLLSLSRAETVAYCAAAGIEPLEDESNRSPTYRRNRLRSETLPALRRYNPCLNAALARLAASAREDLDYIETVAATAVSRDGETVRIDRGLVAGWPAGLQSHAVRAGLRAAVGDLAGFSSRHIEALRSLLTGRKGGGTLDLPRGIEAILTKKALLLRPSRPAKAPLPDGCVPLAVPGEATIGPWRARALEGAVEMDGTSACVDAAAVADGLWLRRRRPGDRIQPLGMSGTKKLQDLFVDAGVPRAERDRVVLFETPRGIVWGGVRVAEWARAKPGEAVVTLALERG